MNRGALHPLEIFLIAAAAGVYFASLLVFIGVLLFVAGLSGAPRLHLPLSFVVSVYWGIVFGLKSHELVLRSEPLEVLAWGVALLIGCVVATASLKWRTDRGLVEVLHLGELGKFIFAARRTSKIAPRNGERLERRASAGSIGPENGEAARVGRPEDVGESGAAEFNPYAIFSLPPGATAAEIKKRYRELLKQYHPDRTAELGPELQDLATRKMASINRAYKELIAGLK